MSDMVHMKKFELTLFGGTEWGVKTPQWLVMQLSQGVAYLRSGTVSNDLTAGSLVVVPPNSGLTLLVSVLGEAVVRGVPIRVSSLSGMLTAAERACLEKEAAGQCGPFCLIPPSHSLSARFQEVFQNDRPLTLPVRLGLMLGFAEWLSPALAKATAAEWKESPELTPKERLKQFLNQMPESELVDVSLSEVAKRLCCCERHASRLFREACGRSFRKHISDLRLNKACQMLAQGDYKIIDVALESGHNSLALFNYMFKNRFQMTPTEWRKRHWPRGRRESRPTRQLAAA
jgi:AraC-like DNA-binding protein